MNRKSAFWATSLFVSLVIVFIGMAYLNSIQKPDMGYTIAQILPIAIGLIGAFISFYRLLRSTKR
jgi:uncharacterized membrane protein